MVVEAREFHRRALVHRQRRRDVEQQQRAHGLRMIEREPVCDSSAAVVSANEEPLMAEIAHEREHVERHRAFAVRRVIRRPIGLVRVAVPAQIGQHERETLAQPFDDAVPDRVRLRKPMQQQEGGASSARRCVVTHVQRDAVGGAPLEAEVRWEEIEHGASVARPPAAVQRSLGGRGRVQPAQKPSRARTCGHDFSPFTRISAASSCGNHSVNAGANVGRARTRANQAATPRQPTVFPHRFHRQCGEAIHIRRHRDVSHRERAAHEPVGLAQCALHLVQIGVVKPDLVAGARCVEALLNPLPFARPRNAAFARAGFEKILEAADALAHDRVPMRDDVRERGAGRVQLLVDGLRPDADASALERCARIQRASREHFVDVFADHGRLDDRRAVVHEHRHDGLGVQC